MAKIEMAGKQYGRLTVVEESPPPNSVKPTREIYWKCKCSCGNEKIIRGSQLRSGKTKSCGYLQKEVTANLRKKDVANQRFGHLLALEPTSLDNNKHYLWRCICDCGRECEVNISNLTGGLVKSCGCEWHNSFDIQQIKQYLQKKDIFFQSEYPIKIGNRTFYFDLFVDNNYIIEYDGEQHFRYKERGWNNQNNFNVTRERDLLKNKYCFENNIPLIRIPYRAKYSIEDVCLKTTNFLLTPDNEQSYYGMEEEGAE